MHPIIATQSEPKREILGNVINDLRRESKLTPEVIDFLNMSRERALADSTVQYRRGAVYTRELTFTD